MAELDKVVKKLERSDKYTGLAIWALVAGYVVTALILSRSFLI